MPAGSSSAIWVFAYRRSTTETRQQYRLLVGDYALSDCQRSLLVQKSTQLPGHFGICSGGIERKADRA
jgi:hypothetical protein